MQFNVSSLLMEAIGATRNYTLDAAFVNPSGEHERVTGDLEFLRTRAGVLVRARLALVEPETCSRCLKPLDEQVAIEFEEEFQSVIDPRTGHPLPDDERDADAFLIDERHVLDLNEAVRQYREVCLLMAPVCRPDCRGLCPTCGADLNEADHDCESTPVDARWADLAALKSVDLPGKE